MTRSGRASCRRAVAMRSPTDTIAITSSANGALPYGYLSKSDKRRVRLLTPGRRVFYWLCWPPSTGSCAVALTGLSRISYDSQVKTPYKKRRQAKRSRVDYYARLAARQSRPLSTAASQALDDANRGDR